MDLVALTEYLVKSIVKEKDMVSVKQFDEEDDYIKPDWCIDSVVLCFSSGDCAI